MTEADTLTVAEANRRHYARHAQDYDLHEECVVGARLRARLEAALDRALAVTGRDPGLRALDACGGSGNASLMLLERGLAPLTLDISPEMLALFRAKAQARGFEARAEVGDVDAFLASADGEWDLIVLSSALHHLDDPEATLVRALCAVRPGGCVVTAFDPRRLGRAGRLARLLDYYAHVVARHPRTLPAKLRGKAEGDPVGALAERHAVSGLDDAALRRSAEAAGATCLLHDRYFEGRFALTRRLLELTRTPTTFGFVLERRP